MKFKLSIFVLVFIVMCLNGLFAQDVKKVFFVPFKGDSSTKSIVDLCNVTIQEDISRVPGFAVADYADIAASLEMEGKNAKSCLEDIECVLASAPTLGINVIVYGKISKDMDVVNIELKMYDAVLGKVEREYTGRLSGETVEVANNTSKLVISLISGAPMPSTDSSTRSIVATPVGGGGQTTTTTTLEGSGSKGKPRVYTWIALGAEAITLSAGITFNLLAKGVNDDLHSGPHNKPDDLISKGETYMLLAWIFYGLAVASTGATIFFFYWEKPKEESTSADIFDLRKNLKISPVLTASDDIYTFGIKGRF